MVLLVMVLLSARKVIELMHKCCRFRGQNKMRCLKPYSLHIVACIQGRTEEPSTNIVIRSVFVRVSYHRFVVMNHEKLVFTTLSG